MGYSFYDKLSVPVCEGLPDTPYSYKAKGQEVKFRFAELDLCPHCEIIRRELNGAYISESLIEETRNKRRQKVIAEINQFCSP